MEGYVTQKKFKEFTEGVLQYMKRHSGDKDIINDLKIRLCDAEKQISALKEQTSKFTSEKENNPLINRTEKLEEEIHKLRLEKQKATNDIEEIENKLLLMQKESQDTKESQNMIGRVSTSTNTNYNRKCRKCDKVFQHRSEFVDHIKKEHKSTLKCTRCDERFNENHKLEEHIHLNHDKCPQYKCVTCDKVFAMEWRLKKHKEGHNIRRKKCHYYNNQKPCPFEIVGCKFKHEDAKLCHHGENCTQHLCQFKHQTH